MGHVERTRGDWQLTESSFAALLAALHPEREEAGRRYELLRARLEFYFSHRQFALADQLADEVLNRIARRFEAGEPIGAVEPYAFGVARYVAQETLRRDSRQARAGAIFAGNILPAQDTSNEEEIQSAVEDCLAARDAQERALLLEYYHAARGEELIERRRRLAASLGITPGALRKRVFLLRGLIEACARARVDGKAKG